MTTGRQKGFLLLAGGLVLAAISWLARPYPDQLGAARTLLEHRTAAERANLTAGVAFLNDTVIRPGEPWSLSESLGPRTVTRGFLPASSRLGSRTVGTLGGGLCQLASTVHLAALRAGLVPLERRGHRAPASSLPPGLDATVWEGGQDLVLWHEGPDPIRLSTRVRGPHLEVAFRGWTTGQRLQWQVLNRRGTWGSTTTVTRRLWLREDSPTSSIRWHSRNEAP